MTEQLVEGVDMIGVMVLLTSGVVLGVTGPADQAEEETGGMMEVACHPSIRDEGVTEAEWTIAVVDMTPLVCMEYLSLSVMWYCKTCKVTCIVMSDV